jgi:hypothetical protein
MLSAVMLSFAEPPQVQIVCLYVLYAKCRKLAPYSECRYAECHYAECRYVEFRSAAPG